MLKNMAKIGMKNVDQNIGYITLRDDVGKREEAFLYIVLS
jgi:hypothetical protein